MREKTLSLLSSLEKGEKEDVFAHIRSVMLNEDGHIRPWIFHALKSFISTFCQLPFEGSSSFGDLVAEYASTKEGPSCPILEERLLASKPLEGKSSLGDLEAENAKTRKAHSRPEMEVRSLVSKVQGDTVQTCKSTEKNRKEEFFKLLQQASNKGDVIFQNVEFLQQCEKVLLLGNGKAMQEEKGRQESMESLARMEEEKRKEEFIILLRQASSKGEDFLKDDAFLQQCVQIFNPSCSKGKKANLNTSLEIKDVMKAGNMEVLEGASSALMEVSPLDKNVFEMEKKEKKGPAGNNHSVKGHGADNGAVLVPMHKVGSFAESEGVQGADKGHKPTSLGDLTPLYADIVKYGKQPTFCPPHMGIFENSISHTTPNVSCMGEGQHVPQKFKGDPLPSFELLTDNNKATVLHAPSFSDSSRENPPLLKIDQETLDRRFNMCQFSVIGKITLAKGEEPWAIRKLRDRLEGIWKLQSAWRLIGLGKGYFQILLLSQEEFDKVWDRGFIQLKPGTLRLQRWSINFDPLKEKTTHAQVWFKIFQLPWGLWDPKVILGIANKVGVPLKIDNATLNGDFGHYARVLVDVDLSKPPISVVHIECGNFTIEVKIVSEKSPSFCNYCRIIGHGVEDCRIRISKEERLKHPKGIRGGEPGLHIAETFDSNVFKKDHHVEKDPTFISAPKKARIDVECIDSAFGLSFVESSVETRIFDEKATKEVFDVTGNKEHAKHTPVLQVTSKGESSKGKSVVESPNRFSVLSEVVEAEDNSLPYISVREHRGSQVSDEDEVRIPNIPERWSDIMDEEEANDKWYSLQEVNESIRQTREDFYSSYHSISDFRAKLNDVWIDRDDSRFDRDMYAVTEPAKNSPAESRPFSVHIPKKDKKVKVGFRISPKR